MSGAIQVPLEVEEAACLGFRPTAHGLLMFVGHF